MEWESEDIGMREEKLEQAISYFRKHTVYDKLFAAMEKKYAAKGQLCGTFVLDDLTIEERNTLSGFMGKDLGKEKGVKISFQALCKALEKSRFDGVHWEEVLESYIGKPLLSNKEKRCHQKEKQDVFKETCLAFCTKEDVRKWLSGLLYEKQNGSLISKKQSDTEREETKQLLKNVVYGLEHLPVDEGNKQILPVYAAEMTGNPHYFDEGTAAYRLLLNYGVQRLGPIEEKASGIEQRESVLYRLGILKDDLSNFCLAYGVTGIKTDGTAHEGLQGFWKEKQAVQMTLHTLNGLSRLEMKGVQNNVYVIENPAVLSYLVKKYPQHTFLCTTGQLKLASYVAMDLLPKECVFYYAGDFDPEGLQIAQGLKKRYGERVIFWNYKRKYYERAISEIALDAVRLKKLDKIEAAELEEIKNCLLTYKKAAYQEKMLDVYVIE